MFKLKKQLYLFKIVLFICLGLLFVINNNNNQVMAMENSKTIQEQKEERIRKNHELVQNKIIIINENLEKREQLEKQIEELKSQPKNKKTNKEIANLEKEIINCTHFIGFHRNQIKMIRRYG
ncbi:hypothetical protein CWO85_00790 [Candidatus Phytoplasma ziziphi]|uniref:Sequence-variable mosaic (SVM) signal sequence domain-containing protein n=1 Tax=Ziziphus jujuba witches'-broom phytoplasma TaxID=135727 RepID=A0A660HMR4_ZIZJU|nr:SVM family protein [Candidatus Phytoplasma ziziphi]AYJ01076.1 hypothetical protein CWO85_00790 [Candidatus Phytoplasma ziziphi]